MVKIKLAGYYTFFHFEVQYKISIIRTINYPCKMANVHPCQVECTLMAFPQTENVKIWSLLMVLQERVITAWSKLICFLPDELLYFIAGWHFKVIMALLTPDNFSCSVVLGDPSTFPFSLCLSLSHSLNGSQRRNKVMTRTERAIWGSSIQLAASNLHIIITHRAFHIDFASR